MYAQIDIRRILRNLDLPVDVEQEAPIAILQEDLVDEAGDSIMVFVVKGLASGSVNAQFTGGRGRLASINRRSNLAITT